MSSDRLRIKYAVLCDQVRREDNGKLIIIGAYGGNIRTGEVPANLLVSILLAIDAQEPASCGVEIAAYLDDTQVISGGGAIDISDVGLSMVTLPNIPLNVSKYGRLSFKVRFEGGEWAEVWAGEFGPSPK